MGLMGMFYCLLSCIVMVFMVSIAVGVYEELCNITV